MAEAATTAPTILDYLDEDCWHMLLKYVPLTDLMRTERVSRSWQSVVLNYLRGVRFNIETSERPRLRYFKDYPGACSIMRSDIPVTSFKLWTRKLGQSVVAMYCQSEEILHIMSENCPNLEAIIICDEEESFLPTIQRGSFKRLRKLILDSSYYTRNLSSNTSDQCLSQITAGNALEVLQIVRNRKITGQCFANIELRNLKSLILHDCSGLQFSRLLAAADHFNGLTRLELCGLESELLYDLPSLLAKTPKLEYFEVLNYAEHSYSFCEIASRLNCLKNLVLHVLGVTDEGLDAVTRNCQYLHSLDVNGSGWDEEMMLRAVAVLRRNAGTRITTLHLGNSFIRDNVVLDIVRSFPNLTLLDVTHCRWLSPTLPVQAVAVRRGMRTHTPLHLHVWGCEKINYYPVANYEEIILHNERRVYNAFSTPGPFEKWMY